MKTSRDKVVAGGFSALNSAACISLYCLKNVTFALFLNFKQAP